MGVKFLIKKIDVQDYLQGSKVLVQVYGTYQTKSEIEAASKDVPFSKVKAHIIDVLMSGIVSPKLSRKDNEPGATFVEHLFTDADLVQGLYKEIIEFTFGKKKLQSVSQGQSLSKSMP